MTNNISTASPLPEHVALWPSATQLLWDGFLTGGSVLLAAALLELTCLGTVEAIVSTSSGRKLYGTAWLYNAINHLGLAPLTYLLGIHLFTSPRAFTRPARVMYCVGMICIHSVGYYCTHRAMHTKALYWAHRYHHRFNSHICPMAASAVTQVEYLFAYMIPFIVAGIVLQPMPMETLSVAALIIGHVNNLIHTPWLEELSIKLVPWFGVSTACHFEHHRKLTTNYAAPTLNVDQLLRLFPKAERAASNLFTSVFGKPIGQAEEKKRL